MPRYKLIADGFPPKTDFGLWSYNPLDGAREWIKGLKFGLSEDGKLVITKEKKPFPPGVPLESIRMSPWGYIPGEALEFAIVSSDAKLTAYARVIPYPIEARRGNAHIWVEHTPSVGKIFLLCGEGFGPNEQMTTKSESNGEVILDSLQAESDGKFNLLLAPRTIGSTNGHAKFSVTCSAGTLTVEYDWGQLGK